jgi:von Willebrand factor type A domain
VEAGAFCLRVPTAYFLKNRNYDIDQVNIGVSAKEAVAVE